MKDLIKLIKMVLLWRRVWTMEQGTEHVHTHYMLRFEKRFSKTAYTFLTTVSEFMYASLFTELRRFDEVLLSEKWFRRSKPYVPINKKIHIEPTRVSKDDKIEFPNGKGWGTIKSVKSHGDLE